ncbi:MAG: diphosphomevalonate decarboxylase, partial [Anaerolineales bacterium]
MTRSATAIAHPNIAFIKYWGNKDNTLRIPSNGSISMNLGALETRSTVEFDTTYTMDRLFINEEELTGPGLHRVSNLLDRVRKMADISSFAVVTSTNNFPMGSGIASSASAFAALSLAATKAVGLSLDLEELSRFARVSSGSACRSIPSGFVEWEMGTDHHSSFAKSIAAPDHWDLVDCISITDYTHKAVSSTDGHEIAFTSPLQNARVSDSNRRLDVCRKTIMDRNFMQLAEIVEQDTHMMHAVMMTSTPPLIYLNPASIDIMKSVYSWRIEEGLNTFYTFDAGPNAHVICKSEIAEKIFERLQKIPGVQEVI